MEDDVIDDVPDPSDLRGRLQQTVGSAYSIERDLGGGMSRVFLAEERALGRRVVIKVLPPELASEVSAMRFEREIRVMADLLHPHILPIHSAGAHGGLLYYVMPYLAGESLRQRLDGEGQLALGDAMRILHEVANALDYAHRRGILHRDIKPDNILIQDGHAVVADFGVAVALEQSATPRVTGTGMAVGTPGYMAPEQLAGDPSVDARADIYSLGVVGYEMLAGDAPFVGPSPQAVLAAQFTGALRPLREVRPELPRQVSDAIARALAPDPAARFQTAAEFRDALTGAARAPSRRERIVPLTWKSAAPLRMLVGAVLALVILGGIIVAGSRNAERRRARTVAAADSGKSIAVLPFVNLSRHPDNEYFSDGMTEELISALTKIPGLRVAARTSAFAFKGKNLDARVIAESLGVATLLEGSVRQAGDRLRVSAQLINARDGYHLWSEEYDRGMADVFAVQEEISRAIAGALQVRLSSDGSAKIIKRPTQDLEAYTLYLRGRHEWQKRTKTGLEKSVEYFRQAIARDSGYARAWAGLADAYLNLTDYRILPAEEAIPKAEAAARYAIALDGTVAEAYASLGGVLEGQLDWRGAEAAYRRAITLDPNYATAHHWYGMMLSGFPDRRGEAIAEARRALESDPLSLPINDDVGLILASMGDYEGAIRQYRRTLDIDPRFPWAHMELGSLYAKLGRSDEAIRELRTALEIVPGDMAVLEALTYAYARAGRRDEARRSLAQLRRTPPGNARALYLGMAFASLGERDSAFHWLERVQLNSRSVIFSTDAPQLDLLRGDPRFQGLRRRLGLVR